MEIISQPVPQEGLVRQHLGSLRQVEGFNEAQVSNCPEDRRASFNQFLRGDFSLLDQEFITSIGVMCPQAAITDIVINTHGIELLAFRIAYNRFELAQQLQIGSSNGGG
jgi:hypothetical protein